MNNLGSEGSLQKFLIKTDMKGEKSMSSENRTKVLIAIIGLIGILGGALFANWDKVFPPLLPPSPEPAPTHLENMPENEPYIPREPPPKEPNEQAEFSQRLEELQMKLEDIEHKQMKAHENIARLSPMLETDSDLQPVIEKEERWLEKLEMRRKHVQSKIDDLHEQR